MTTLCLDQRGDLKNASALLYVATTHLRRAEARLVRAAVNERLAGSNRIDEIIEKLRALRKEATSLSTTLSEEANL